MNASPRKGFARLIKPGHAAVARDLGYVLTLDSREAWDGFTLVLTARLTPQERAELARAAVLAMDDRDLTMILDALDAQAGPPVAPLDGAAEEAASWADWASADELRAYAVACTLRMSQRDQSDFLDFLQRRAAA